MRREVPGDGRDARIQNGGLVAVKNYNHYSVHQNIKDVVGVPS